MKNKNKKSQSGSAHAIVVIILVIALLGSLGFIFWQNFLQKKDNDQNINKQSTSQPANNTPVTNNSNEVKLTEIAADQSAGTSLALKYPKDWQMTHQSIGPQDTILTEKYAILSPSGKIKINFWISNGGFGGTCEDIDGDEIQYINKESLSAFSNAEYIEYYFSTGYFAGIHQTSKTTSVAKVGDSACNLGLSGALSPINNTKNIENMALHLDIEFPEIGYDGKSSVEKFKEIIKTDDYKTAKSIVKSIHVKN